MDRRGRNVEKWTGETNRCITCGEMHLNDMAKSIWTSEQYTCICLLDMFFTRFRHLVSGTCSHSAARGTVGNKGTFDFILSDFSGVGGVIAPCTQIKFLYIKFKNNLLYWPCFVCEEPGAHENNQHILPPNFLYSAAWSNYKSPPTPLGGTKTIG